MLMINQPLCLILSGNTNSTKGAPRLSSCLIKSYTKIVKASVMDSVGSILTIDSSVDAD